MGWQSFVIFYTTKTELNNIIKAMDEYQHIVYNHESISELEQVGEELSMICFAKMKKPYVKEEMKGNYAVLFGIGGGRGSCYAFFMERNTKINLFEECNINRFERQKKWFVPFDEFKKFPENIVEQLVEKKLVDN